MNNIKVFEKGHLVNTIVADEAFAQAYCKKHGYTYELEPEPPAPEPEETYTADDLFAALLGLTEKEETT